MGKFTNPTSDRGLISNTYIELKKVGTKIPNNQNKEWDTDLNREYSTEETQMAKRHLRNCSTSLTIREIQIKITEIPSDAYQNH